jgi:colicin import membrane protein
LVGAAAGTAGAGGDDRARAEALVAAAKASPSANRLVGEPLVKAEDALHRADQARRSGDSPHAALLDGLGREWAETAQTLLLAQQAEQKAADLEGRTAELDAKTTRARALLEETVARRGRARSSLDALEAQADGGTARDGGRP